MCQRTLGDRFSHTRHGDLDGGHGQLSPGCDATAGARLRTDQAETRCGTGSPMAARAISACSRSCTTFEPVAGLALESLPTYCTARPKSSSSRGFTKLQAPMFCDSSCTQTHSRAER